MQIIAIVVPMVFVIGIYMKRRNVYDLHHGILGKFLMLAKFIFFSTRVVPGVVITHSSFLTCTQYMWQAFCFLFL